jgi:ADP-L-glycero-D-manno-heptose 6-epimerase
LVRYLNENYGVRPVIYDRLDSVGDKWRNVAGLNFELRSAEDLRLKAGTYPSGSTPHILIHLGADVDTTAPFSRELWDNNVGLSLTLFQRFGRVVYASSAAVYGAEEFDFAERIEGLKPLNPYAFTKWTLDNMVFGNGADEFYRWSWSRFYGLRLFNVYGPNESHKGNMASVVHKALRREGDILCNWEEFTNPYWSLFKSHREGIDDGEQKRDFIHVDDVCSVICHFALKGEDSSPPNGIYNVGTGKARSFNELVKIVDPELPVRYRDMPEGLRHQYQYHTRADLTRLRTAGGYTKPFLSLEEGIERMRSST